MPVELAHLCVFDLLADAGQDLRPQPYLARRACLRRGTGDCRLPLLMVRHTGDRRVASAWLTEHAGASLHRTGQGLVARGLSSDLSTGVFRRCEVSPPRTDRCLNR